MLRDPLRPDIDEILRPNYPNLAANMVNTMTGQHVLAPTFSKTVGGVKIGFIGLTSDIVKYTYSLLAPGLTFTEGEKAYTELINKYAATLRSEGHTVVVVTSELGLPKNWRLAQTIDRGAVLRYFLGSHSRADIDAVDLRQRSADLRIEAIIAALAARSRLQPPSCLSAPPQHSHLRPGWCGQSSSCRLQSRSRSTKKSFPRCWRTRAFSRRDFVSKWALLFLTRLSWLNPIACGLYRCIGLELECASDKLAGRITGLHGTLARTLVKTNCLIKDQPPNRSQYLTVGACSSLEARIEHLTEVAAEPYVTGIVKTILILILLMPVCFPIAPLWLYLTS